MKEEPYALARVTRGKSGFLDRGERTPVQQAEHLLQGITMRDVSLGACLDSCRWGSETTVLYEMSVQELIEFISHWLTVQIGKKQFHEVNIHEAYTDMKLPHTACTTCPRDKTHTGTMRDLAGRVRCAHHEILRVKGKRVYAHSYVDPFSNVVCTYYTRESRLDDTPDDLLDACYALLSDEALLLPLETVLERLATPANPDEHQFHRSYIEFPFDGWQLAAYVQLWSEQCERPPLFMKK